MIARETAELFINDSKVLYIYWPEIATHILENISVIK